MHLRGNLELQDEHNSDLRQAPPCAVSGMAGEPLPGLPAEHAGAPDSRAVARPRAGRPTRRMEIEGPAR